MYDGCNEYTYLPFCRLIIDAYFDQFGLGICVWHYSGNSIPHCSISQKGIGICFTVITSIVTGHKSVSVIL